MNLVDSFFARFVPHRCPHCHKIYASQTIGEKLLRTQHKGKGIGKILAGNEFQNAPIIERHGVYELAHRCKFCGHQWVTTQTKKMG